MDLAVTYLVPICGADLYVAVAPYCVMYHRGSQHSFSTFFSFDSALAGYFILNCKYVFSLTRVQVADSQDSVASQIVLAGMCLNPPYQQPSCGVGRKTISR